MRHPPRRKRRDSLLAEDRLVRLLVAADDGLDFCEISPYVDVSDSAVSNALTLLCDAGLVENEKRGRSRHYRATKRATALIAVLDGTRSVGP